jgi:hypothetical protein
MAKPGIRRVLISQDRHEVYITCATYTTEYVRYLRKQLDHPPAEDLFLTMNEFGPFVLRKESNVRDLGSVLLALTLKWGK